MIGKSANKIGASNLYFIFVFEKNRFIVITKKNSSNIQMK